MYTNKKHEQNGTIAQHLKCFNKSIYPVYYSHEKFMMNNNLHDTMFYLPSDSNSSNKYDDFMKLSQYFIIYKRFKQGVLLNDENVVDIIEIGRAHV